MTDTITMHADAPSQATPQWQPLTAVQRRILGVLAEKAKTTPDSYPLSLNALKSGCNQKSNRSPQMDLADEEIEDALEQLRELGAVTFVQAGSRVERYRHRAYEWLGIDKVELAVMAELLLRGAQTVGELRGRAARMEPIAGLEELRPILAGLAEKGLLVRLTPAGRGQVVTHALHSQHELEKLKRDYGVSIESTSAPEVRPASHADQHNTRMSLAVPAAGPLSSSPIPKSNSGLGASTSPSNLVELDALEVQIRLLRQELASAKADFQKALTEASTATRQLRDDFNEFVRQLGN